MCLKIGCREWRSSKLAAKEHVEIYLRVAKEEQIAHATAPLINRKKELREQVKEQTDHKDEIIIHKDKTWVH